MSDRYKVTITGITPLLMHRDAFDDEETTVVSGGPKGDDRSPPDRWKSYLYMEGGRVVLPEANLKAALEHAGAAIPLGGRKTLKRPIVAGCFFESPFIPLTVNGKEVTKKDIDNIKGDFKQQCAQAEKLGITLDVRRVKIGTSRHIRVRPRFDKWEAKELCEVVLPEITEIRLRECLRLAGRNAGLCDYRPSSPKRAGSFGRFETLLTKSK